MEVEVREEASVGGHRTGDSTALLVNNTPIYTATDGPIVIVRVEEVLLVVLVLIIWMAAIALFFNRWGKIRMLEPYQPKFRNQASHRPSCPLAPLSPPGITPQVSNNNNTLPRTQKPTTQRMSFSKYNVNAMTDPLSALPSPIIRRPRRNSVFVGGGNSTMAILHPPPRRVKSAIDIQHLIVNDHSPTSLSGSVIPILNRDRRPSITIERPHRHHHRPSITIDRVPPPRLRRSSCFVGERLLHHHRSHRNFISFDHPIERPSCSYHHHHHSPLQTTTTILPTVSFEAHHVPSSSTTSSSSERITAVTVEIPPPPPPPSPPPPQSSSSSSSSTSSSSSSSSTGTTITTTIRQHCFPKMSKSFEQPPKEKLRTERMANSLDVTTSISFDRRCLIPEEEDRASPVFICLDETKVTAPLLESLKSSDV